MIDKIALINPLNDDYFIKKKSIANFGALKEEEIHLRISYGNKSIDDFEVGYEKEAYVPLFNFNSNKSQITSHNSKNANPFMKGNTNCSSVNYFKLFLNNNFFLGKR